MLGEMDLKVEIKEEPIWLEGTANSSLDGYISNAVVNGNIVNDESPTSVIPKVEKDALGPSTEDVTPVENFEFVSTMIPLKQETKSELTEPGSTQENTFEILRMNEEGLVLLVKQYPHLYDLSHPKYHNNLAKDTSGDEISKEVGHSEANIVESKKEKNFTEQDKNILIDIVEQFISIIGSKCTDATSVKEKNTAWEEITKLYNANCQLPKQLHYLYDTLKRKAWQHISDDKPSKGVKNEIIIEEHTVDQQLTSMTEENNPENAEVLTKGVVHSCDVCCRVFSGKNLLKSHVLTHCDDKPYHCTVCNKTFSLVDDFHKHIFHHSKTPPYCCTMCMKIFTRKDTLKLHLRTHSADKPYRCHVCQDAFSLKSYLNKHLLTHSGKRPFCCTVCKRRFAEQSDLHKHLATHSGDRQYSCTECQATFFSKYHLKRHINTVKCGTLYMWCI